MWWAWPDYLAQHSLVLWVELLWKSHHFPCPMSLGCCSFLVASTSCPRSPGFFLFSVFLGAPFPCFGFTYPKYHFFCLNFCSILIAYQYAVLSEEMSRKSISSWMYLCKQPLYLSTKFHSEYLIPNFMRRVWKTLVKSNMSWTLPCRNVVHFMYLSL